MESLSFQLQPFLEWLLRTTLQASLLICLILLLQIMLRGRLGIRWHYCLWLLLLVRMALPWSPQSRASIFNLVPKSIPQRRMEYAAEPVEDESAKSEVTSADTSELTPASATKVAQDSPDAVIVTPHLREEAKGRLKLTFSELADILPLVWLAGALVLGIYICLNNFALLRIVRRERPLTDQKILDLLEDCKAEMGIRIILGVVSTKKVKSASLFGFVRPRLLLPEGMIETLSREELRYVFLHELAHLKRHDIYVGWLMSLLQVLHWFNPLIWLAFYRMRADRELACDALVLARTQSGRAKDYGRIIVSLLERFSRSQRLPAMAGILETKAQLKRRITMIARFKKNSYQWSPLAVVLIIVLGCVSLPDAKHTKASGISATKPPGIVVRQVLADSADPYFMGAPSPDGKYLSYVDWETGDLAVHELASGKSRRLTNEGWGKGRPTYSIFSPDSKYVACRWRARDGGGLRIISLDGSERRFIKHPEGITILRPTNWSTDGKHILVLGGAMWDDSDKDFKFLKILFVSVEDGDARVLKTIERLPDRKRSGQFQMSLSPDGRYVAYSFPPADNSGKGDIWVFGTDGGPEIRLVEHPADDFILGWTPDNKRVVFASDRTGSMGIWAVEVTEGKTQGTPQLLKAEVGRFHPLGLTQSGSFYYGVYSGGNNVYTAIFDPQKVNLAAKPVIAVHRYEGSNWAPDWSPDGRYLVCVSAGPGASPVFLIHSVETGEVRELSPDLKTFNVHSLRWSADGRSLLGAGSTANGPWGALQIDIKTGKITTIIEGPGIFGPEWAADGEAVFYVCNLKTNGKIFRHDCATGEKKELYSAQGFISALVLSPDGRQLAFHDIQGGAIKVLPATGGQPRELVRVEGKITIAWTPGGRHLFYGTRGLGEGPGQLWRIPTEGGESQKLDLEMPNLGHLRFHPDGRQITFTGVAEKEKVEIWVMENFLPEATVAKPEPKMTVRREGDWGTIWAKISPDGKYLCDLCLSDANNALVARELATGKEHFLVRKVNEGDYIRGTSPVISPDSKTVAYRWHDGQEKTFQLQLINLDGSQRRTIRSGENIIPEDWSPDGKRLLALRLDQPHCWENTQFEFVWVSVKDGSVQSITEVPKGRVLALGGDEVALSPDGRFIAYDVEFPQPDGTSKYTIFLFSIEDSREVRIEHPAQEWLLGWTPDGKYIFFVSDRSGEGERDGWLLPVADGKPQGRARLVCPNMGKVTARAGFTRSGDYYYGTRWVVGNVYTVGVDLKEGRALSGCEPVHPGLYGCPAWSPDGQYLAYYAEGPKNIRIRSLATGQERVLEPDLPTIRWFTWSPDGRSLLASSFWVRWIQKPTARSVYQIDIKTCQSSVLMETDVGRIVRAELSPDQKSVFYTTRGALLVRNLETGREKKISEFKSASRDCWDLSPDGKRLVIADPDPNSSCQLKIISVKGEQLVELLPQDWDPPHDVYPWFRSVAWAPDGLSVLLSIQKDYHHAVLWQISAKGGQPRQIFTTGKLGYWPSGFCVHPDGKLVAFQTADVQGAGLWVMENFLPATVASAEK